MDKLMNFIKKPNYNNLLPVIEVLISINYGQPKINYKVAYYIKDTNTFKLVLECDMPSSVLSYLLSTNKIIYGDINDYDPINNRLILHVKDILNFNKVDYISNELKIKELCECVCTGNYFQIFECIKTICSSINKFKNIRPSSYRCERRELYYKTTIVYRYGCMKTIANNFSKDYIVNIMKDNIVKDKSSIVKYEMYSNHFNKNQKKITFIIFSKEPYYFSTTWIGNQRS